MKIAPRIGDTEHFVPESAAEVAQAKWRRRQSVMVRKEGFKASNQSQSAALKSIRDVEERIERENDPLERAKTFMRQRGVSNVHAGWVIGLPKDCTVVGGVVFTDDQLIRHVKLLRAGKPGLRPSQKRWVKWKGPKATKRVAEDRGELYREVMAFLKEEGMSESRFSNLVYGNGHLFPILQRGSLKPSTIKKVRHFMASYRND